MRIFVTGATGTLGLPLCRDLVARGHTVRALSRRPDVARARLGPEVEIVGGDPGEPGPWQAQVAGCDAAINLAGEPLIGRRWSAAQKRVLHASRVAATRHLVEALTSARVLISASAVGYYGSGDGPALDESAPPGDDFVARLCVDWEAATAPAEGRARVVRLRIGVVLSRQGGALEQMVRPFRLHVGGHVGSGRQVVSWIHEDDLRGILLFALDHEALRGAVNATAPSPATMAELARAIGRRLGRRSWAKVPGPLVKLALGEVADVVLQGQRVLPRAALAAGYRFRFPDLDSALADLLPAG